MRAMRAEQFGGYEALKLVELPKPTASDGRVLLRITAAGVTPLDHTILSGKYHTTKVPLVLGNEGAGVVEADGGTDFPAAVRRLHTVRRAKLKCVRSLRNLHLSSSFCGSRP